MFPTLEQINSADRYAICKYYRFSRSPQNEEEIKIMNRLCERFKEMGGFTPEISKSVGWSKT